MPRYLIERRFEVDENDMPRIGRKSNQVIAGLPGIIWEHSHVVIDSAGKVTSFCVYTAPNEAIVHEHAVGLGEHKVERVWEIGGDVSPEDFPPL